MCVSISIVWVCDVYRGHLVQFNAHPNGTNDKDFLMDHCTSATLGAVSTEVSPKHGKRKDPSSKETVLLLLSYIYIYMQNS